MTRVLFPFLLLFTFSLGAQCTVPGSELLSDIREVHELLVREHPFAYYGEGRAQLDSVLIAVEMDLAASEPADSVSCLDLMSQVARFQRVLEDGHFQFLPVPAKEAKKSFLPLAFTELSGGGYATIAPIPVPGDTVAAGTRVQRVNGEAVSEIISKMANSAGLNDRGADRNSRYYIARSFGTAYSTYYGEQDTVSVTLIDSSRQERSVKAGRIEIPEERRVAPKDRPKPVSSYTLTRSEDSTAWVISLGSWSEKKLGNVKFKRITREHFKTIRESDIDRLIIDLRNNTGGSLSNVREMLAYLYRGPFRPVSVIESKAPSASGVNFWHSIGLRLMGGVRKRNGQFVQPSESKLLKPKRAEKRYAGELVVLINSLSFSASGIFVNHIQGSNRGTVVGQTTGASNGFVYGGKRQQFTVGETRKFHLKLMNWRIGMPYFRAGTVAPDVEIPITLELINSEEDWWLREAMKVFAQTGD